MNEQDRKPHSIPYFVAVREALAKLPPAPLESVMKQAKASEEWRKRQSSRREP